uniref:NADH-ubiquinone oxidoreductase chain 4 n=1 Tax=Pneumocystis canis TaxID=2698477 RepID=A0A8A6W5A6_9ASCO|nr:NADH dehydrogenase subunit 4 [Pneumocystis canis]QTK22337.1 NADH dehydrogenase subunit 4 [Pneumocystis canis]QTK22367.1 NADH dehydrogenase subunit 4 [Pneumocystis canis]
MLSLLVLIPIIGIIIIMFLPKTKESITVKKVGLFFSLVDLWISLYIWGLLDSNNNSDQLVNCISSNSYYSITLVVDGISICFILLTTIIFPIALLSNWSNLNKSSVPVKYYVILMLMIESLLLLVFTVSDLILFYVFFESILPPLFILIGLYGSSQKIRASFHLFLYTLLGSLLMLLSFLMIYFITGTTDFTLLKDISIDIFTQKIIWMGIFLALAIKTPLIPLHLWLPLAHAESPLGGSIILAGIVLKLSLYGVLRIVLPFLPEASLYFTPFVYTICVLTIIYASLTTLRQVDLKVIIAYSSIGHMAMCIMGAFSNNLQGLVGSLFLSLAHGLVSPALFICVGGILYDRTHTRILNYYRGLGNYLPLFSLMFFIFSLCNIAVPFSANFIGEFLIISGAFQRIPLLTFLACISIVLSAAYGIWLFIRIVGGSYTLYLGVLDDISKREFYLLMPLLLLTIILGVKPDIILNILYSSLTSILY